MNNLIVVLRKIIATLRDMVYGVLFSGFISVIPILYLSFLNKTFTLPDKDVVLYILLLGQTLAFVLFTFRGYVVNLLTSIDQVKHLMLTLNNNNKKKVK